MLTYEWNRESDGAGFHNSVGFFFHDNKVQNTQNGPRMRMWRRCDTNNIHKSTAKRRKRRVIFSNDKDDDDPFTLVFSASIQYSECILCSYKKILSTLIAIIFTIIVVKSFIFLHLFTKLYIKLKVITHFVY